jgi:TPR repeat protein
MRMCIVVVAALLVGCGGGSSRPGTGQGSGLPEVAGESNAELLKELRAFEAQVTVDQAAPAYGVRWHIDRVEKLDAAPKEQRELVSRLARDYLREYGMLHAVGGEPTPESSIVAFDAMCKAGDLPACATYANLITGVAASDEVVERSQPFRKRACDGGYLGACYSWGTYRWDTDKPAAEAMLVRACDGGHATGCGWLAAGLASLQPERAFAYNKRGCELGDGMACHSLGVFYSGAYGTKEDRALRAAAFQRGCDLHLGLGCMELAEDLEKDGGAADKIKALRVRGCTLDWGERPCAGIMPRPSKRR